MTTPSSGKPYAIAACTGALLWMAGSWTSGEREAWDSGSYWAIFYPAAIGACAALGYMFPERPWRWCLALFAAQFATMALLSGEIGSLAPLGFVLFGILAVPAIGAAWLTSGLRRRKP
jgi:hypothetical protein